MRVGIDGSNLRQGGGVTHLVQLLEAAEPQGSGIGQITVWGARQLLDQLPERPWLVRVREGELEKGDVSRLWWRQVRLAAIARRSVDLLFSPGGIYLGEFHPFVAMFRNMLPFDAAERHRYGYSRMRVKLEVLRRAQAATFNHADGVIFLTEHARRRVTEAVEVRGCQTVIPHGLDPRFSSPAVRQRGLQEFSPAKPFRWLYVSAIHSYKHPWNVVEAVAMLRAEGMPVRLDLVGPPYPPAMVRLKATIAHFDRAGELVTVTAERSHADLPQVYRKADGFVFASTCENMPFSLLEAMAAGLPIICSDRAPMPEILGPGAVFCNPEAPASIAGAMKQLMIDAALRTRLVQVAQSRAREYNWSRCAKGTFDFLAEVGAPHVRTERGLGAKRIRGPQGHQSRGTA